VTEVKSKEDLILEIAALVGMEPPGMSTGSTGRKEIFIMVNETLGLGITSTSSKPAMARSIVEASGEVWLPSFESTGSTVTRDGLRAVLRSVYFFLGN
jgi:hypothetical protein